MLWCCHTVPVLKLSRPNALLRPSEKCFMRQQHNIIRNNLENNLGWAMFCNHVRLTLQPKYIKSDIFCNWLNKFYLAVEFSLLREADFYVLTQASRIPSGRRRQPSDTTFERVSDEYSHSPNTHLCTLQKTFRMLWFSQGTWEKLHLRCFKTPQM